MSDQPQPPDNGPYRTVEEPSDRLTIDELAAIVATYRVESASLERITIMLKGDPYRHAQAAVAGAMVLVAGVTTFFTLEPIVFWRLGVQLVCLLAIIEGTRLLCPRDQPAVTLFPGYLGCLERQRWQETPRAVYAVTYGSDHTKAIVAGRLRRRRMLLSRTLSRQADAALVRLFPQQDPSGEGARTYPYQSRRNIGSNFPVYLQCVSQEDPQKLQLVTRFGGSYAALWVLVSVANLLVPPWWYRWPGPLPLQLALALPLASIHVLGWPIIELRAGSPLATMKRRFRRDLVDNVTATSFGEIDTTDQDGSFWFKELAMKFLGRWYEVTGPDPLPEVYAYLVHYCLEGFDEAWRAYAEWEAHRKRRDRRPSAAPARDANISN